MVNSAQNPYGIWFCEPCRFQRQSFSVKVWELYGAVDSKLRFTKEIHLFKTKAEYWRNAQGWSILFWRKNKRSTRDYHVIVKTERFETNLCT